MPDPRQYLRRWRPTVSRNGAVERDAPARPGQPRSVSYSERGTDRRDDRPCERDRDQRAQEARAEEPPTDPGQRKELKRDRRERDQYRGPVIGNEERQRVKHAAKQRADAGDRAAGVRAAAAG